MDRNTRRDDRGGRRDEPRGQKPRYEREQRSRSPQHERRNDRRHSRSPPPRSSRNAPAQRQDRANDRPGPRNPRDRQTSQTPEPGRHGRGAPRDTHAHNSDHRAGKQAASYKPDNLSRDVHMGNGVEDEDEDSEAEMARVMGFKDFRTTKNTKVPGNDKNYAVSKVKKAEYRQYMNRVGGFNRPLSPGRGRD